MDEQARLLISNGLPSWRHIDHHWWLPRRTSTESGVVAHGQQLHKGKLHRGHLHGAMHSIVSYSVLDQGKATFT